MYLSTKYFGPNPGLNTVKGLWSYKTEKCTYLMQLVMQNTLKLLCQHVPYEMQYVMFML